MSFYYLLTFTLCIISINAQSDVTDAVTKASTKAATRAVTRAATTAAPPLNPNDYLDNVLVEVNKLIKEQNYDPYNALEYGFLNVQLKGELYGLSNWYRQGDVKRVVNKISKIIEIDADIGVKNLTSKLNWTVSLGFFPATGKVVSTVDDVSTNIRFRVNEDTKIVIVTKFKVTKVGKINTEVKAIPIPFMDRITAMVASAVGNMAKNTVARLVERSIRDLVQDTLNHFAVSGIPL